MIFIIRILKKAAAWRLFSFVGKGNAMKKTLQFRRKRPFVMVDYAVVMSGQLSVYELAVYLVLCAYADSREGTCFPSYQTIASKAGCSRRKAIDAVARLESLGLIRKEVYRLIAAGALPAVRAGRGYRILKAALVEWLGAGETCG